MPDLQSTYWPFVLNLFHAILSTCIFIQSPMPASQRVFEMCLYPTILGTAQVANGRNVMYSSVTCDTVNRRNSMPVGLCTMCALYCNVRYRFVSFRSVFFSRFFGGGDFDTKSNDVYIFMCVKKAHHAIVPF